MGPTLTDLFIFQPNAAPLPEDAVILPLRKGTDITEEGMEKVYAMLRELDVARLERMWKEADPYTRMGALLRWQIGFTLDKKQRGIW